MTIVHLFGALAIGYFVEFPVWIAEFFLGYGSDLSGATRFSIITIGLYLPSVTYYFAVRQVFVIVAPAIGFIIARVQKIYVWHVDEWEYTEYPFGGLSHGIRLIFEKNYWDIHIVFYVAAAYFLLSITVMVYDRH